MCSHLRAVDASGDVYCSLVMGKSRVAPTKITTYQANRRICTLKVASEENPADHTSRGHTAEQHAAFNWFTGPTFLWKNQLPSGDVKLSEIASSDRAQEGYGSSKHPSKRGEVTFRLPTQVLQLVSRLLKAITSFKS